MSIWQLPAVTSRPARSPLNAGGAGPASTEQDEWLKSLGKIHATFAAAGSDLVLTGVEPRARDVLARTGLLSQLGDANVLPSDPHIGASLDAGLRRGRERLSELGATRT